MKRLFKGLVFQVVFAVVFTMVAVTGVSAKELMFLPFKYGTRVKCVQGNNGSYSHRGKMEYAYDFILPSGDIFGTYLYSPVTGEVVESRQGVADYKYNSESSSRNNYGWGNTLLLHDSATDKYVRIAHMKEGSCSLKRGDKVRVGQKIGRVGCTGYSSEAHLHIHMQDESASTAYSKEFAFIEGNVKEGRSFYSELEANVFVLDAGGGMSMAHEMAVYSTYKSPGWSHSSTNSSNKMTAGESYKIECDEDKSQWYKWKFRPSRTGVYAVYVRADSSGNKDEEARYRLYSYDDDEFETEIFIDQNESTPNELKYLVTTAFNKGDTYYINLYPTTDGDDVTADSLIFYRLY